MPAEHGLTDVVQLLYTLITGQQIHRTRSEAHQSKRIWVHMRCSGTQVSDSCTEAEYAKGIVRPCAAAAAQLFAEVAMHPAGRQHVSNSRLSPCSWALGKE